MRKRCDFRWTRVCHVVGGVLRRREIIGVVEEIFLLLGEMDMPLLLGAFSFVRVRRDMCMGVSVSNLYGACKCSDF